MATEGNVKAAVVPSMRLAQMGLTLPSAAQPSFNYVPVVIDRGIAYVSGQLPKVDGEVRVSESDVRARRKDWRHSLAIRCGQFGQCWSCRCRRHRLLGDWICEIRHRRKREPPVLRLEPRRKVMSLTFARSCVYGSATPRHSFHDNCLPRFTRRRTRDSSGLL